MCALSLLLSSPLPLRYQSGSRTIPLEIILNWISLLSPALACPWAPEALSLPACQGAKGDSLWAAIAHQKPGESWKGGRRATGRKMFPSLPPPPRCTLLKQQFKGTVTWSGVQSMSVCWGGACAAAAAAAWRWLEVSVQLLTLQMEECMQAALLPAPQQHPL